MIFDMVDEPEEVLKRVQEVTELYKHYYDDFYYHACFLCREYTSDPVNEAQLSDEEAELQQKIEEYQNQINEIEREIRVLALARISERYVAHIESIYFANGDSLRRRYSSASTSNHNTTTTTFIGKAKNATGKSPNVVCKIEVTTAPTTTIAVVTRAVRCNFTICIKKTFR